MEGVLKPDFHYILLKNDFSDLEERLFYYSQNRDKAKSILRNAHIFLNQFKNKRLEKIILLKILNKYFENTKPIYGLMCLSIPLSIQ